MLHSSLSRSPLTFFAPLALSLLAGCAPIKFYPGEERADSTIGRLLFNSLGAELSAITIDGTPHPHPGRTVEILPGPHRIEITYAERFEDAGDKVTFGSGEDDDPVGVGLVRYGRCELRFSIEAAQELFVYVDAGSHPLLGASIPPTITLKEQGFNKPALYQERCKEEGRQPKVRAVY